MARPRLLFLAYYFPPVQAVACVRTLNLTKYLSRMGWSITVVTPSPSLWRRVDRVEGLEELLSHEGIRRVFTGHRWRGLLPFYLKHREVGLSRLFYGVSRKIARSFDIEMEAGWGRQVARTCEQFLPGEFDLILASGGPFISFHVAKVLSERLGCPFVLDYRDLWTGFPHLVRPRSQRTARKEEAILRSCAAATIVGPSWKEYIGNHFGVKKNLFVVPNGYDAEDLQSVRPTQFDHFAVVYSGIFYPPDRVVTPFFAALRKLQDTVQPNGIDWRFHYYGIHEKHVRDEAKKYNILDRVVVHGFVPRKEVLSAIRGANVALVIASIQEEAPLEFRGIVTGKIFEPVGLGTPVMLIAPKGSDAASIVEATSVGRQFTGTEVDRMASFLIQLMGDCVDRAKIPQEYSWAHIAKRMDAILRAACQR